MSLSGPSRHFAAARQFGLFGVKLVGWVEPTGPAQSGRPDDRLRETHPTALVTYFPEISLWLPRLLGL